MFSLKILQMKWSIKFIGKIILTDDDILCGIKCDQSNK